MPPRQPMKPPRSVQGGRGATALKARVHAATVQTEFGRSCHVQRGWVERCVGTRVRRGQQTAPYRARQHSQIRVGRGAPISRSLCKNPPPQNMRCQPHTCSHPTAHPPHRPAYLLTSSSTCPARQSRPNRDQATDTTGRCINASLQRPTLCRGRWGAHHGVGLARASLTVGKHSSIVAREGSLNQRPHALLVDTLLRRHLRPLKGVTRLEGA